MTQRVIKFRAWHKKERHFLARTELRDPLHVPVVPFESSFQLENDGVAFQQFTGLLDKNGREIWEGDVVSLDGNMTADDSLGWLPNGWIFDEHDRYAVEWDDKLAGWVLAMPTKYDDKDEEVVKYLNHARGLLVGGSVEIIGNVFSNPELL